jgi:hypothetical protein
VKKNYPLEEELPCWNKKYPFEEITCNPVEEKNFIS